MDITTSDRLVSFVIGRPYTGKYNWGNIVLHIWAHTAGSLGWLLHLVGILGVGAGSHRLWTHRSYKANLPYRILMMLCQTSSVELDIATWVLWHRCHHKFGDTNADPHSIKRGFFFAHMGWTMLRPHEEFETKKHQIDMSDVENDPVCTFQSRYYYWICTVMVALQIVIPVYFWGESLLVASCIPQLHWLITSHITYTTNRDHSSVFVDNFIPLFSMQKIVAGK